MTLLFPATGQLILQFVGFAYHRGLVLQERGLAMGKNRSYRSFIIALAVAASGGLVAGGALTAAGVQGVTAFVAAPAKSALPATKAAVNTSGPVFNETLKLFKSALVPGMTGSIVMGSLKSTDDPGLEPFFLTISHARSPELQLIGLLDANAVSKNPRLINVEKFLAIPIPRLIGPSLAVMIQSGHITSAQLMEIVHKAIEPSQKLMAASELVNRGKSAQVIKVLDALTRSQTDATRYYAALTLLQCKQPGQAERGLKLLMQLAARTAPRLLDLKDALLARVAAQKITAAAPWAAEIARANKNPWSLRRRAVQSLLVLNNPMAPKLLAAMLKDAKGTIDKIELGLLAIQYPKGLALSDVQTLRQTDSPLLTGIARTAAACVSGKDPLPGILSLIEQGQPIFLNWALAYADNKATPHRLMILTALINYATAAGDGQDTDFRRAVAAATILANNDGNAERKILSADLDSPNAGIVEAVLAGMIQSHHRNFSTLIQPWWKQLLKRDSRKIREFAAMELARENKKVELSVLRNIALYGLGRSDGFRAAAGWYYVKLTGRAEALIAAVQKASRAALIDKN